MAFGGASWDRFGRNRPASRPTPTRPRTSARRGPPTNLTPGSVLSGAGQANNPVYNQFWSTYGVRPQAGGPGAGTDAYRAYRAMSSQLSGVNPFGTQTVAPGGGGGGGGYGGGGGGGGGAPAMTQALLDSMLSVLGARAPALTLQQSQLPAFRGANLPAFNAAPYTQATQQLTAAGEADRAAAAAAADQAQQALTANYTNSYANTPVQATPAAPQVGAALQATAGGGGNQAAQAAQQNQAAASDQASFANLLAVLGAADQQAQSSRLNQVALDRGTAMNNIGAQQRGLLGGIQMAQTQAQNQWGQADAERRYQNSLMQQQWARENQMRNQDLLNQQRQANWQQSNEFISSRLTPLLELLGGTAGTKLNLTGLQNMLRGWTGPRA